MRPDGRCPEVSLKDVAQSVLAAEAKVAEATRLLTEPEGKSAEQVPLRACSRR